MTTTQRFWLLQLSSWGLFSLLNLVLRGYFSHYAIGELVNTMTLLVALLLSSSLLRLHYRRYLSPTLSLAALQVLVAALLAAILTAAIVAAVLLPNQQWLFGEVDDNAPMQVLYSLPNLYILFLGWSIIYIVVKRQRALKEVQHQQQQLTTSLQHSQMDLLLNQLSPHFVFNAINNIRALILEDKHKARTCLADLSEVLRVTMQVRQDKVWPLADEVALVSSYLALNELQFEKRLQVKWQLAPELLQLQLPCMLLQLMVENAIKHGIARLTQGGVITISVACEDRQLRLTVTNPGQLQANNEAKGIGITNIHQRLQLLYGSKASFALRQLNSDVAACVVIDMEVLCSTP
jgi:two-component system, LytTR family, sensor kinase